MTALNTVFPAPRPGAVLICDVGPRWLPGAVCSAFPARRAVTVSLGAPPCFLSEKTGFEMPSALGLLA